MLSEIKSNFKKNHQKLLLIQQEPLTSLLLPMAVLHTDWLEQLVDGQQIVLSLQIVHMQLHGSLRELAVDLLLWHVLDILEGYKDLDVFVRLVPACNRSFE